MEAETALFESSGMLATFVASSPFLTESWRLCSLANTTAPESFVTDHIGTTGYIAFSGIQNVCGSDPGFRNLVQMDCTDGLFAPLLRRGEGEDPAMVHAGFLHLFHTVYSCPRFQSEALAIMQKSKSIIITGHSVGGTTASLVSLWLLSYLQQTSISSPLSILCITFGSPLLGNESLSRAILHKKWSGNFCHVVLGNDVVPRLLFAPLESLTSQLHFLLQYWQMSMASPHFAELNTQVLAKEVKAELFLFVLAHVGESARAERSSYWPFGNYLFCSDEGEICVDNAKATVKMLRFMFRMSESGDYGIKEHVKYGDWVEKVSSRFMTRRVVEGEREYSESSYEAGLDLALQSCGISRQVSIVGEAKECLKMARRLGRTPNLNRAYLAIELSKKTPIRAQIEWYKRCCDESEDQMGYYDSFKQRGASKKHSKINMNRIKLATFWDEVIRKFDANELPHDFDKGAKWVYTSQFYKLLVEPLDIAEYYRTNMHRVKGHYVEHGRERRYHIMDKWWRAHNSNVEENNKRSKFASLTQDSCFWARLEEARDWVHDVRRERDGRKLTFLWENIHNFDNYSRRLVDRKEVSIDVLAENSSYSRWMEDLRDLKSQLHYFPQLPGFFDGGMVP